MSIIVRWHIQWERAKWVQQCQFSCMYCGITIVPWGPMFVGFVNNSCPWIYIPMNLYTITFSYLLRFSHLHYQWNYVPTKQENLGYPWTPTPTNKNDSPVYLQIYDTIDSARLLTRCTSWWIFYTCHTAPDSCLPPSDGSVSAKQKQIRLKIQTFIHLEVEVFIKLGTTTSLFLHVLSSLSIFVKFWTCKHFSILSKNLNSNNACLIR